MIIKRLGFLALSFQKKAESVTRLNDTISVTRTEQDFRENIKELHIPIILFKYGLKIFMVVVLRKLNVGLRDHS